MAISQFPIPQRATSFAATMAAANVSYNHINEFQPGTYTITTNPTSVQVTATFYASDTVITTQTTVSGTIGFALSSRATGVVITMLNTGAQAGAVATITRSANSLTSTTIGNGTLDTINTTSTYNTTGLLAVLVIGGGAAGDRGGIAFGGPGGGGRAGFINAGVVFSTQAQTVTIGSGGVAATTSTATTVAPTNSSFGNLVTATAASNIWTNANGGPPVGYQSAGIAGGTTQTFVSWTGNQTTGGGGSGNGSSSLVGAKPTNPGGGSGIGTGGSSAGGGGGDRNSYFPTTNATAGTGRGSGGGGGCSIGYGQDNHPGRMGANGAAGVVYVLRGW